MCALRSFVRYIAAWRSYLTWYCKLYGGGLEQLVATLVRSTNLLYAGPGSTGMGDRIGVQLPVREIYLSLTNHLGQLSTGQKAVMLCDWE